MDDSCKILIVDDHALFRHGVSTMLSTVDGIEVVGEAANGAEFVAMLPETEVDVVLLDIDMPVMNGFDAAAEAMRLVPGIKIITLSMFGEEDYYFKMVSLGVKGFLLKNSDIKDVVDAIFTVRAGGTYFSQELLFNLVSSLKSSAVNDGVSEENENALSDREIEILLLICKGLSNQEIADRLFISKRTVDKHRANILAKTGCKNTANLVVFAIKEGYVEI